MKQKSPNFRSSQKNTAKIITNSILGIVVAGAVGAGIKYSGVLSSTPKAAKAPVKKVVVKQKPLPSKILLTVTPQTQGPQLPNGAEVTTLSMLLSAVKHPVSKVTLAKHLHIDPTKEVIKSYKDSSGQNVFQIIKWGDPNVGYVGNMYQPGKGYGVYHGPILALLKKEYPKHGVDLTGKAFSTILATVGRRTPVEVWSTLTFQPTHSWISWLSPQGKILATPKENTGLIVGYNKIKSLIYVDNPGNGKLETIPMKPFVQAWKQLGSQAITVNVHMAAPKTSGKSKKATGKNTHKKKA